MVLSGQVLTPSVAVVSSTRSLCLPSLFSEGLSESLCHQNPRRLTRFCVLLWTKLERGLLLFPHTIALFVPSAQAKYGLCEPLAHTVLGIL